VMVARHVLALKRGVPVPSECVILNVPAGNTAVSTLLPGWLTPPAVNAPVATLSASAQFGFTYDRTPAQTLTPVILIWDNLNTHVSAAMRAFIDAHPDWLTEARLPAYAPDLNAVEGAWANMKNGLGNLAASDVDQLTAIIKNRLKSIQYRPALIEAFLAQTGLTLEPEPP